MEVIANPHYTHDLFKRFALDLPKVTNFIPVRVPIFGHVASTLMLRAEQLGDHCRPKEEILKALFVSVPSA